MKEMHFYQRRKMRELMMKMTTGLLDIRQRPPLLGRDCSNCPRSYEEILSAFCNINDRSGRGRILKSCRYKSLQTAAAPFCQTSKRFNFQSYTSQVNGMHLKHCNPMHTGLEELERNIKKCNELGEEINCPATVLCHLSQPNPNPYKN